MGPLTTHVLNTATGLPAVNVKIVIDKNVCSSGNNYVWQKIGETNTNSDGRAPNLLSNNEEVYDYVFHSKF